MTTNPPILAVAISAGEQSLRAFTSVWDEEFETLAAHPEVLAGLGLRTAFKATDTPAASWAILDEATGEFAGLLRLTPLPDVGEHSLTLALAEPRWFDQGIGTRVLDALFTHAFDSAGAVRIHAQIPVDNARAIRVFERLGFRSGRQFGTGPVRFQRMVLDKLGFIGAMAERLMGESLDTQRWSFGFDAGKRRAGLCDHTNSRISLSRYMSALHEVDQSRQVMYHEIAHALAGAKHGHDAQWLRIATGLGYRNERISAKTVDEAHAAWVGVCPNGHEYFRYRKPTRISSCSKCSRGYDDRYRISWTQRK